MSLILSGPNLSDWPLADAPACLAGARLCPPSSHPERRTLCADGLDATDATCEPLAGFLDTQRIDWIDVAARYRWGDFKLLAMDMDSTLITIECVDEIADLAGRKAEVSAITEAAMRGEIRDYAESLRRRVKLLAGLPEEALKRVFDERLRLSPGAELLIRTAKSHGIRTLVVSGGFTYFTSRLRTQLQLDYAHSNVLGIEHGRLTGEVEGEIVDAEGKAAAVSRICAELGVTTRQAIVVGDGANDLRMMQGAGVSIAFHAKPVVAAQSRHAIRHGGLDTILDWFD